MLPQQETEVLERFLRYVKIDTQSNPESTSYPSTEKQKDLGRILVDELHAMGISDAELNEFGLVYATIPSTVPHEVPVFFLCAHMDTSPDYSGKDVNPQLFPQYDGGKLILPKGGIVIDPAKHPDLGMQLGGTIITSDGSTLLGADNKAGVAEIMAAASFLMRNPDVPHGAIRILFTPDEEIGRGVDKVDTAKLNARFGYTIDGETRGHLETETFSADAATVHFTGVPAHPGFAKGTMRNAIKMAANFVSRLPVHTLSPETTAGMEGFVHPTGIHGNLELAKVDLIIRDFTIKGLQEKAEMLKRLAGEVQLDYPDTQVSVEIREQYRNMREVLNAHPEVEAYAMEAMRRAGLTPVSSSIRGGTDGSRLSFMGLPCPNIFAGEHAFHSPYEWVSLEDMQFVVASLVHLAQVIAEKAKSA
jgi:tripeptide aminopeptidase